jgi:hypothetical protein
VDWRVVTIHQREDRRFLLIAQSTHELVIDDQAFPFRVMRLC